MLLCNHQYEWFENFLQMFRGFLRDVKLIFKLMLHIDTYIDIDIYVAYCRAKRLDRLG